MKINRGFVSSFSAVAVSVVLAACAAPGPSGSGYPGQPNAYPSSQAYSGYGQVTAVDFVRNGQSQGWAGAAVGGVVGGLLGNQVGGGTGRAVATVAGVVGGALVGRHVDQNMDRNKVEHYRVTVQMDNGGTRTFDYAEPPSVRVGDRVRAEGDQLYR